VAETEGSKRADQITPQKTPGTSGTSGPEAKVSGERWARYLLAGAFPLIVTGVLVAFGLILQLRSGRLNAPPSTLAGQVIAVSAVAGVASMATVQVVKSLSGLRGLYQQRQVKAWLERRPGGAKGYSQFLKALTPADTGGKKPSDLRYLFNLPIEQLCAQVSSAADLALESPPEHFDQFLRSIAGSSAPPRTSPWVPGGDQIQFSHNIRTGIDQLQVSVGHRWRTYIRATAVWLSGLIGVAIVEASHPPARERGLGILASVLVGGFLSWFARDVAAVVERLRG